MLLQRQSKLADVALAQTIRLIHDVPERQHYARLSVAIRAILEASEAATLDETGSGRLVNVWLQLLVCLARFASFRFRPVVYRL